MTKYIVHDTLEAFVRNDRDMKDYFFGLTTAASVSKNITQELLRAGLHNKVFGVLSTDDGMSLSITTGLHYKDVYEIQSGSEFEQSSTVTVHEIKELEDGSLDVTEKSELVGEVLEFKAGALPKSMFVQLRTIAYDKDSQEPVADIYYIFPNCVPDGNINEEFGAGTNQTQEITLTPLVPTGSDSYGKYVIIPREQPPIDPEI